jgi:lysozyme family protein
MRKKDMDYYSDCFAKMKYGADIKKQAAEKIKVIKKNWQEYWIAGSSLNVSPVFLALVHIMEADGDMNKQILNGQPVTEKTTIAPEGWGPWKSWKESTFAVVDSRPYIKNAVTGELILWYMEKWNGWGYAKQGKHSPYIFGGTDLCENSGKYIADGVYDPHAETKQAGAAVLLAVGMQSNAFPALDSPVFNGPCKPPPFPLKNASWPIESVVLFQRFFNQCVDGIFSEKQPKKLVVDGICGPKTQKSLRVVMFE